LCTKRSPPLIKSEIDQTGNNNVLTNNNNNLNLNRKMNNFSNSSSSSSSGSSSADAILSSAKTIWSPGKKTLLPDLWLHF
jgi:hypothetical protein